MPGSGKFDEEHISKICINLTLGMPKRYASIQAGINEDTFYRWLQLHSEFAERVAQAESDFIRNNLGIIQVAAKKNWQASAWLLERRKPDEFGAKTQMHLNPGLMPSEAEHAQAKRKERVTKRLNEILEKKDALLLDTRARARAGVDNFDAKSVDKSPQVPENGAQNGNGAAGHAEEGIVLE